MIQKLHPLTKRGLELLGEAASGRGLSFTVTSGFRSLAKQWELWQRWKTGSPRQRLPVAYPGTSTHNFGLALDIVPNDPRRQNELVQLAKGIGFVWAGPRDPVHFQVLPQATWTQALQLSPKNPLRVLR